MFFLPLQNKTGILKETLIGFLSFLSVLFLFYRNAEANYRLYPIISHVTLQPGEKESHAIHFHNNSDENIKLKANLCTLSSKKNGGRIISNKIPEFLEKMIKLSGESFHVSSHHEAVLKLHIKPPKKIKPSSNAVCIAFTILPVDQNTNEKVESEPLLREPLITEFFIEIGKLGYRNISLDEMQISHKPNWVDFVLPIKNNGDRFERVEGDISILSVNRDVIAKTAFKTGFIHPHSDLNIPIRIFHSLSEGKYKTLVNFSFSLDYPTLQKEQLFLVNPSL